MRAILKLIAPVLALCAHIGVASAQTDEQSEPAPVTEPTVTESMPGIIVLPPRRSPMMLPGMQRPENQDGQTCPATDQKKLELIG